jgi:hypothetical protein
VTGGFDPRIDVGTANADVLALTFGQHADTSQAGEPPT